MRRICFLFNHEQLHQVAHSLPIAMRMVEIEGAQVTLAFSDPRLEAHARAIAGAMWSRFHVVQIGLRRRASKIISSTLQSVVPARKILLYRDNLDFFRGFDALVVPEKTSLLLKTRYGLEDVKLIHTRHGAGDRAIGFNPQSRLFDLTLVSGPKIARRLTEAGVDPARIRMVGYPKFDLYAENKPASPFANDWPIVLYAPHPSPKLSSYYLMGKQVIEQIAGAGRYNLIFAPHVMLMRRRWTLTIAPPALARVPQPDPAIMAQDNVLLDTGSPALADMSYTNLADIYVGDVSSQIYEFLLHPRPCLNLNAHDVPWQGDPDYGHWRSGPVIGAQDDILSGLLNAVASWPEYSGVQRDLREDTFSMTQQPAGVRAAQAIWTYLNAEK